MIRALLSALLLTPLLAQAGGLSQLCTDVLSQDKQPAFQASGFDTNQSVLITRESPPRLQLNTNLTVLDPERIYFPFDQHVTISYVFESAGASHALGYLYLDDVKARGYADANGNLVDANGNGILDLHEDLYNLAPTSGSRARPYIGPAAASGTPNRRCNVPFTSGGFTYNQPELAMNGSCASTFSSQQSVKDARPGQTGNTIKVDLVGSTMGGAPTSPAFSDRGVFDYIPNLLEPADPRNNKLGLGRMVFLLSDDDTDTSAFNNIPPVADSSATADGVPDYDVSRYDANGLQRATNPDPGITAYDRTVDLGQIEGGKEVVFFLVVFYDATHAPSTSGGTVFPCLRRDSDDKCTLHLRTSVSVFFSKAAWNLDQNAVGGTTTAERNIGCSYNSSCNPSSPSTSNGACAVAGSSQLLCGWLEGPKSNVNSTLGRLNTPAYGNLNMPMEKESIPRPANNRMAHVIMGAPSTDPFRWILGFEDLNGGGDRDFNDVVFMINKENGGGVRSGTVSGDISPDIAEDFTITKVRFRRQDDLAPAPRTCSGGAPCWSEELPGACRPAGGPLPTIRYSVAVDCRVCAAGVCTRNPNPTWYPVEFPNTSPPTQEVELDMLALGFTGSQLCWKADITSPNERCRPVIDNVDVGYQAVRAGTYARASPSTLGNALVWGANETPGRGWGQGWTSPGYAGMPAASQRAYDGTTDLAVRGHLYFRSLYDPEAPTRTNVVERWNGGRVMAVAFAQGRDPASRRLFTLDASGMRTEVQTAAADNASTSPLFPDSLCDQVVNGRYVYDLNNDGTCGTPTHPFKRIDDDTNDRAFLREWLYGWEDLHTPGPANVRRAWPVGGINLSTVALAVPPFFDAWYQGARAAERDQYRKNFMEPLKERRTVAYVGTVSGYLHAFDAGAFRTGARDGCLDQEQQRGYFAPTACGARTVPRDYGTGEEQFAYLPRLLLERYVNRYARFLGSGNLPRPQVDASPTIANVDFGVPGKPAWTLSGTPSRTQGAKTVLVSATGKGSPAVFALDVTRPDLPAQFPLPLWEFSLADGAVQQSFTDARNADRSTPKRVKLPDDSGSRHAPSVVRLAWGASRGPVWSAVVGTDYVPSSGRAGTLYLLDMKTGRPLDLGTGGRMAGVITLDDGSGIAGESAMVDLDQDGTYEVLYVPTTAGRVYRINLDRVDTSAPLGAQVSRCRVADAPVDVSLSSSAARSQDQSYQQLYSNLAVKVVDSSTGPIVRFYFGTADNPDESSDGPADNTRYQYHLLGYEDPDPTGARGCVALSPLWVRPLDAGQAVWGGVSLSQDKVYATTAVGKAADICSLSSTESGRFYAVGQLNTGTLAPETSSAALQGHGVSAPVVHDEHLFVLTADGKMLMVGGDAWNNDTGSAGATRSRVLLWESVPEGRMPK
ncbi:DUF4114 domain-containing protein [Corallococcus macrosporus]|uniref:DUF4114 domain-containing protein n=1 Tax=Corallococcus macrosporus TaxID=35 RepID=A0ABS3DAI6_9BACT|nr:PilC/PilY family type IV pilus protein [Corallococcus macrosporus]MBN8228016.1 DUF4114 domain-containing protein [Corallococcus macrosporus]